MILPEILAGLLSVGVVCNLVRRRFGTAAGLEAALALAITPIAVATGRNNSMDSTLTSTLLLAARSFAKATESDKLRYLLLGAVLAGLVAIGFLQLWRMRGQWPWQAIGLLLAAAVATMRPQYATATAFVGPVWWLPLAVALLVVGAVLLVFSVSRKLRRGVVSGFACVAGAILLTPGIWSGLTTLNSSDNQWLLTAYSGRQSGPAKRGGVQLNPALPDYLEALTQDAAYLMAVPSSIQGSDHIIATGRPVLLGCGRLPSGQERDRDEHAEAQQHLGWRLAG